MLITSPTIRRVMDRWKPQKIGPIPAFMALSEMALIRKIGATMSQERSLQGSVTSEADVVLRSAS